MSDWNFQTLDPEHLTIHLISTSWLSTELPKQMLASRSFLSKRLISRYQLLDARHISRRLNSSTPKDEDKKSLAKPDQGTIPAKKIEYVPQASYSRVSFEYPPPPNPEPAKPKESSPWKRHIPYVFAVGTVVWALYVYNQFFDNKKDVENHILIPETFSTFKITYKENISEDTALIELSPKFDTYREILKKNGTLWNGKKMWSIEVKQPQIQVVRRYTPLPLYYMQYQDGDKIKGLLRMLGEDDDEGRMVLLVKKYDDGEVSRYLHELPLGADVQIRGPYFGYKFPFSPVDKLPHREPMEDVPSRMMPEFDTPEGMPKAESLAFFAGGTGIAPILQSLLSKNPPRGPVQVFYSVRDRSEIPFPRFLLFLEKAGRAKFHYFVDSEKKFITDKDIPEPAPKHYQPAPQSLRSEEEIKREDEIQKMMEKIKKEKGIKEVTPPTSVEDNPRLKYRSVLDQVSANKSKYYDEPSTIAVVCGPQGYVNYVAGDPGFNRDQPIGGLLQTKGWNTDNAYRMEN